ncbi:hypothetical protein Scep_023197 [Stephania cephalantha]|uniref:peptidyl-tRNA hydrolase n=1 Tax=Stephania cephalantha TaxID=152367 RepID=A0AAP0EZN1_9MAGN
MDVMWLGAFLVGAGCIALGYLLGTRRRHLLRHFAADEVIVDKRKRRIPFWRSRSSPKFLKISKWSPKDMLHFVSHATLGLYKKLLHRAPKALNRWEMCGQVKVVLKIESEEDMLVLQERAKSMKLANHITIDAGRTQIAPNSRTVMALLGPADMVDDVTGSLKLL